MDTQEKEPRTLNGLAAIIPGFNAALNKARAMPRLKAPRSRPISLVGVVDATHSAGTPIAPPLVTVADSELHPDLQDILRKVDTEENITDVELRALVARYQQSPKSNPLLFDAILDALNPTICRRIKFLAGSQETLGYHAGVRYLKETLPRTDIEIRKGTPSFLIDPANKAQRHPNLGKTSSFFLIPKLIQRLTLGFPLSSEDSFSRYISANLQQVIAETAYPSDETRENSASDDHSLPVVWAKNRERRRFVGSLVRQFQLSTDGFGNSILINEVEHLYGYLFKKHWYPAIKHRGFIIAEDALWDDIIKPILREMAKNYEKLNPNTDIATINGAQSGRIRSESFSTVFRNFALPAATKRFNAILRETRKHRLVGRITDETEEVDANSFAAVEIQISIESDKAAAVKILKRLPPRTRTFWKSYTRQKLLVAKRNLGRKRIEGLVFKAVAAELDSTPNHSRNKIYEVRRRLEAAGLREPPKRRGRAAVRSAA